MVAFRKVVRTFAWGLVVLIALLVVAVLLLDTVARPILQRELSVALNSRVEIGKAVVGLRTPTLRLEEFKIFNSDDFDGVLLAAFRRVHLKLLRMHVEELNIVTNEQGRVNLQRADSGPEGSATLQRKEAGWEFSGIDTLEVTVERVRFLNLRVPGETRADEVGLRGETFEDVKTEEDFLAVATVLALRSGIPLDVAWFRRSNRTSIAPDSGP
jgi:hypothetical protein